MQKFSRLFPFARQRHYGRREGESADGDLADSFDSRCNKARKDWEPKKTAKAGEKSQKQREFQLTYKPIHIRVGNQCSEQEAVSEICCIEVTLCRQMVRVQPCRGLEKNNLHVFQGSGRTGRDCAPGFTLAMTRKCSGRLKLLIYAKPRLLISCGVPKSDQA
jgi:hypothetical protein